MKLGRGIAVAVAAVLIAFTSPRVPAQQMPPAQVHVSNTLQEPVDVYVAPLEGGSPSFLGTLEAGAGNAVEAAPGEQLLFASNRQSFQTYAVTAEPSQSVEVRRVAVAPVVPSTPAASAPAPAVSASTPPASAAAPADPATSVRRDVAAIAVNKWPEGLALAGGSLWVAESGARTIAEISLQTVRVVSRQTVGRLPVGMLATATGRIFANVNTDKKLWRLAPNLPGGKGVTTTIPECPVDLAGDDTAIWILTDVGCSSGASKLFRAHPGDGKMSPVASLGPGAFDVADAGGWVVVVHTVGSSSALTFVDKKTGDARGFRLGDKRLHHVAAVGEMAFAAGAVGPEAAPTGVIVASDVAGNSFLSEAHTAERIAALATQAGYLIAVSEKGMIWIYDARAMVMVREIQTTIGPFAPRSVIANDQSIFISTHQGAGENGSIFVVNDWQPAGGSAKR